MIRYKPELVTIYKIAQYNTIRPQGFIFLRAKAATALARLSHRNSVCLSVCHTGGSVKNGAF